MTKVRYVVPKDPSINSALVHGTLSNTRDYVNHSGLSRTAIFNQVEASLARLKTSYVDVLQIHAFDDTTPIEETMKALHDLVQIGKVRYLGASNLRTWQLAEMNRVAEVNGWTPFVSTQVEYSLLYRTEVRARVLPALRLRTDSMLEHRRSRCLHTASTRGLG